MDKLHDVMRNLKGERKSEMPKADHLTVFRDFIQHLDRLARAPQRPPRSKSPRAVKRRTKR